MTGVGSVDGADETDIVADVVGGGVGEAGSCRCLKCEMRRMRVPKAPVKRQEV